MPTPSPISPGVSWYEDALGERPTYPPLDGDLKVDVAIVGGGFTGLSAAAHLAKAGASVALVEAHRLGDGASGRNGGQLGTGQRAWPEELEAELGFTRAKALFDLAEEGKAHLLGFARDNGIETDFRPGQLSVAHKPRHVDAYRRHADAMAERFGYPEIAFMDRKETPRRLGSGAYFGGTRDTGTGHVDPLKLLVGTAAVAFAAGAKLFEQTRATAVSSSPAGVTIRTARGIIRAGKALLALNAHGGALEPETAAHVAPIRSFIAATAPLPDTAGVLPGNESVDDSRFVVRYFRKAADGRLLFGGREAYFGDSQADIRAGMARLIASTFPQLRGVEITHAWGGSVGITLTRKPFVREVMPNVISAGGYSGHGVVFANFVGKLYAETLAGDRSRLKLLEDLKVPAFPGGRLLRQPLLALALGWYALRDRF